MPLTPEAVQQKTFTSVRLRAGYDMGEVDQFLDEVEEELARLLTANEQLRSKQAARPTTAAPLPAVGTVQEASSTAARLLEIATDNADQLVNQAKADADVIVHEALSRAERDRQSLEHELDELRAFERDHRSRLKGYLESQLQALDGQAETDVPLTPPPDGEITGQLRQLLSEQPS